MDLPVKGDAIISYIKVSFWHLLCTCVGDENKNEMKWNMHLARKYVNDGLALSGTKTNTWQNSL